MKKIFRILKLSLGICLALLLASSLLLVHARYIAPYDFEDKTTVIESAHISDSASGLKIVEFGDTHLGHYYTLAQFSKVVDAINAQKPDLVFFAGDLVDTFETYSEDTAELSALLAKIQAPSGKYCVYGNHDYGGGAEREYPKIMKNGGFKLLVNENIAIDSLKLNIIGIDDMLIGYGNVTAAKKTLDSYYNIVLAHEPDIADEIATYQIDLMLSGHTHGRQVNIKGLDNYILPPYGKHYVEGLYTFDSSPRKMVLYVTPGIGTTQIPIRFNSRPEISVFLLAKITPAV